MNISKKIYLQGGNLHPAILAHTNLFSNTNGTEVTCWILIRTGVLISPGQVRYAFDPFFQSCLDSITDYLHYYQQNFDYLQCLISHIIEKSMILFTSFGVFFSNGFVFSNFDSLSALKTKIWFVIFTLAVLLT